MQVSDVLSGGQSLPPSDAAICKDRVLVCCPISAPHVTEQVLHAALQGTSVVCFHICVDQYTLIIAQRHALETLCQCNTGAELCNLESERILQGILHALSKKGAGSTAIKTVPNRNSAISRARSLVACSLLLTISALQARTCCSEWSTNVVCCNNMCMIPFVPRKQARGHTDVQTRPHIDLPRHTRI